MTDIPAAIATAREMLDGAAFVLFPPLCDGNKTDKTIAITKREVDAIEALVEVAETGSCGGCGGSVERYDDPGPFMCMCTRARECRHHTKPPVVCVACRVLRDFDAQIKELS